MPKTYTAAGSATAGGVYTASAHNVIVTNVNNFIVPPACKAVRTTAQTIANASSVAIQFNAADAFDTDAMHDTSTNNTRVTVNTSGIYVVTGTLNLASNLTGNYRLINIRKNGSEELAHQNMTGAAAGADPRFSIATIDAAANATDYYELVIYQDSGGNLNTNIVSGLSATLSVVWIGRTS